MARPHVELYPGDLVIRGGGGERLGAAVELMLTHDQRLKLHITATGPGDNLRRINVLWKQGPLLRDPERSIGFAILDPIYKTLHGANGERL